MTDQTGAPAGTAGSGAFPAAGAPAAEGRHSFRGKSWFWLPVVPLIALDLWSKSVVFSYLGAKYPGAGTHLKEPVWSGWLRFDLVAWYNTGTVWGVLREYTDLLVGLRFVAIGLLIWFAWTISRLERLQLFVLGMLLSGAVGNLYDNLTVEAPGFEGGVRDFLFFTFGTYEFPAFNVADSCITIGALCLVVLLLREEHR